ncbi:MAG: DUF3422 domain-containing protein [Actinomycetes bacterium]
MSAIRLPGDHPARTLLANEVHARPPAPVSAPAAVSGLALLGASPGESYAHLRALAATAGQDLPETVPTHIVVDLGEVRISWARHGEFVRFTFIHPLPGATIEGLSVFPTAFDALPADWLASLPGETIAAIDIALFPDCADPLAIGPVTPWFDGSALAGAVILDGAGRIFTDFLPRSDDGGARRTRWIVLDTAMGPAQVARVIQRVLEIEIYRMVALLALPLARTALPALEQIERRLAEITAATAALHGEVDNVQSQREERRLLDELTRVAAEVENSVAETAFRFSAGQAYWKLVRSRVAELREQRIGGMRTIGGFLGRRLAPAMNSAAAAAQRQEELSARIERASTLLRTRVDIALEEQNQKLLAAMDRRSQTSLRIQQAVEGLSVAAITYYAASLVSYFVKPFKHVWPSLNTDWVVAGAIPVLAFASWRVLEKMRAGFHE